METDAVSGTGSADAYDVVRRYSLAILAGVIALALRWLLTPLLGENNPYHNAWAAVAFSAWYCGLGPSIVTTRVGVAGVWYLFLPRIHLLELQDPKGELFGMLGFLVFSGLIVALGEAN